MENNINEEVKEEIKPQENEQNHEEIQNNFEPKERKNKSNKVFVTILVVIAIALAIFCALILGYKLGSSEKDKKDEPKENEVVENKDNKNNDKLDNNEGKDNQVTKEEPKITYIDIKTEYVNKTNKKYNMQLAKKEYVHVYQNGLSENRVEYAIYDADNKKLITGYDYHDGPYADVNRGVSYDLVEKIANVSVINVNGIDYLYIYVVGSGFEDMGGYFLIYNPNDGNIIKGNTYSIGSIEEKSYLYDNGQFAVMLNVGMPEISEGWYKDTVRSDSTVEDLIIFSMDGKFIRKQASDIFINNNKTFSLYTMDSEENFEKADYSKTKVEIYGIDGKIIKTYNNVVSVINDYVLVLENEDLVLYNIINETKNIIEKNVSKDYIYRPFMSMSNEVSNTIEIERQKKSSYNAWSNGETITYHIDK